jgi:glycosyltransferase involved in cell wall biosynthesis
LSIHIGPSREIDAVVLLDVETGDAAAESRSPIGRDSEPEVSVVIPCLNEADTLGACVRVALRVLAERGISGEVIVADNGSTDGSVEIAQECGARVVPVARRGYGAALAGGIEAARGTFVIMGDADLSYDFAEIPNFLALLRDGNDLVQGCRLPAGRGRIEPGAMPFLHRWWGNPMFSALARRMFASPVTDIYCGLRGFRRDWQRDLDQRCTGMEFANEMIIKASLQGARIAEIPITLHVDGRRSHPPHLRTFRDGWRTLRFYLLYSPRWLFLIPGTVLIVLAAIGYAVALPGMRLLGVHFDVSTLLFATLAALLGYQAVVFGVTSQAFAVSEGFIPRGRWISRLLEVSTLERGIAAGALVALAGMALLGGAVHQWWAAGFGDLVYPEVLRLVIPGTLLSALGAQTVLASFFLALFGIHRR